ncbi:taste receptor type 2 member 9-like [Lepisosteus oculatus]|uniref:taste receptor type 2 member 9-like n=1 Tax=Lepisosteus oculatus TaxID=7918 RepID=UPI0003EAB364|nr:PREDICTED: taste receptor type 2 member 114-like [Lepisosteus oculatus]
MNLVVYGGFAGNALLSFFAVTGNVFIICSNMCRAWTITKEAKERKNLFLAGEIIITCITLANLLLSLSGFTWIAIKTFEMHCQVGLTGYRGLTYALILGGSSSFWFTSCLCTFYLLKIVSIPNAAFNKLKQNVSTFVLVFLGGSFALCCIFSFPAVYAQNIHYINASTGPDNFTVQSCKISAELSGVSFEFAMFNGFVLLVAPAGIMLLACVGLVLYLCHHMHHMKRSRRSPEAPESSPSHSPALLAQTRISKMIVCLVVVYLICDLILFFLLCGGYTSANLQVVSFFGALAMSAFAVGIASLLTYGNANLKKDLTFLFPCCLNSLTK